MVTDMSFDLIKLILTQKYELTDFDLQPDTPMQDVCVDSLELIELLMFIEDEYGIVIADEDAQKLEKVGDIAAYLEAHFSEDELESLYEKVSGQN